jgi:hypothetical protein
LAPDLFGGRARRRVSKLAAGLYHIRGVWVRPAEQVVSAFGLVKSPTALHAVGVAAIVAALAFAALPARQALAQCATTGTDQTCTNPAGSVVTDAVNGWGIQDSDSLNLTNFGRVTGTDYGVIANNDTTVANSGTVSGGNIAGIWTFGIANVTNSGAISGGTYGIIGFNGVNVVNSNGVSGSQYGIYTNIDANVTNSGSISSGFIGISTGNDANVTNSGSITGDFQAISAGNNANVTNSGNIFGGSYAGIVASNNATVTNSGTISGATFGILANNIATVINSGTISSSDIAIYSPSSANVTNSGTIVAYGAIIVGGGGGSILTNSGTIIGTSGIAIDFSSSNTDTMNFMPGSRVFGEIGLGTGDTVNIRTGRDIAWMMTFGAGCGCGGGIVSTGSTVNVTGGAPYVINGNQIATLDPTAFGLADRTLTDFTGTISSLLASRFGEFASPGAGGAGPLAFALSSTVADGTNAAFAKIAALAYADGGNMADAAATDRASGITVWSKAFAGARHQDADGPSLAATNTVYGGVLGLDKDVAADLRLGAFLGAGTGRLDVDANSQAVKTDYAFGGVYGRFDRSSHFLDFAVSTGHAANDSSRTVADNLAPTGLDTATASYGAWFVSPELAYGLRMPLNNKVTLTPTARLRYVAGFFDGYSETGSTQNLSVSARTVQDLEERFELALSQVDRLRGDAWVKTRVTLGVLDLERLGSTTIDTILIGQNLSFAVPGQDTAAGVYGGIGFDYALTGRVTAFTAFDGTVMTDKSIAGTVKGGLRAAL